MTPGQIQVYLALGGLAIGGFLAIFKRTRNWGLVICGASALAGISAPRP